MFDVSRSAGVPRSGRDVSPTDNLIDAGVHGGEQVRELVFGVNLVRGSHRKHQFLIEENLADRAMLVNSQDGFGDERRDGKHLYLAVELFFGGNRNRIGDYHLLYARVT